MGLSFYGSIINGDFIICIINGATRVLVTNSTIKANSTRFKCFSSCWKGIIHDYHDLLDLSKYLKLANFPSRVHVRAHIILDAHAHQITKDKMSRLKSPTDVNGNVGIYCEAINAPEGEKPPKGVSSPESAEQAYTHVHEREMRSIDKPKA